MRVTAKTLSPLLLLFALAGCSLFDRADGEGPPTVTGPPPPKIVALSRTSGAVHTRVDILGTDFGPQREENFVRFGMLTAKILFWSEGKITVRVPVIPTPGGRATEAPIAVVVGRQASNEAAFTVVRGIVYASMQTPPGLYVMNPDGSEPTLLLAATSRWPPSLWEGDPAWSPDGTRIAFSSYDINLLQATGGCQEPAFSSFFCTEIFVIDADGSALVRVTRNAYADRHPTWSPDERRLAFYSDRTDDHERNAQLYVIRTDGTAEEKLTENSVSNEDPDWSPDGRRIAFTYRKSGIVGFTDEVAMLDLESSNVTTLFSGSNPAWSPDGGRIAFRCNIAICVMSADGGSVTTLTGKANDDQPAWSPQGDRIAFARQEVSSQRYELWSIGAGGGPPLRLTDAQGCPGVHPECELGPDWF